MAIMNTVRQQRLEQKLVIVPFSLGGGKMGSAFYGTRRSNC